MTSEIRHRNCEPQYLVSDKTYAQALTCVGPVNITVTQNKVFTPSTGIDF